jgi:Flp pilus assembly protein TadD
MSTSSTGRFLPRLRRAALLFPLALAVAAAGCASAKKKPEMTGSVSAPLTDADVQWAADYWGERYRTDAADKTVALNYAAALKRIGRPAQAVAVLQGAAIRFPRDREVLAAYGKALAANGDLARALETVQSAQTVDQPDWRLLSAEAAILDQMGRNREARRLYAEALTLAPNEPTTLSNYGMSHVLTGELAEAERLLRQAVAMPGADSRVRQNLALVVGLSGRFEEARQIAATELSPDQAAANVAYLKSMLSQPNSWQALRTGGSDSGGETPADGS